MADKNENPAVREATGAFIRSLLDATLPAIREAARFHGYAIAVHGTLKRDIDLIAVAWTEQAKPADTLVTAICGAVGGVLGNCFALTKISEKPHGRLSCTLVHPGFAGEIDLSIIPPLPTWASEMRDAAIDVVNLMDDTAKQDSGASQAFRRLETAISNSTPL